LRLVPKKKASQKEYGEFPVVWETKKGELEELKDFGGRGGAKNKNLSARNWKEKQRGIQERGFLSGRGGRGEDSARRMGSKGGEASDTRSIGFAKKKEGKKEKSWSQIRGRPNKEKKTNNKRGEEKKGEGEGVITIGGGGEKKLNLHRSLSGDGRVEGDPIWKEERDEIINATNRLNYRMDLETPMMIPKKKKQRRRVTGERPRSITFLGGGQS